MYLQKRYVIVFFVLLASCIQVSGQGYSFKILTDINQVWREELPFAQRLESDGVWSLPGNSGNIPLNEWKAGFEKIGCDLVFTEEYFKRFPNRAFNLTRDIVGHDDIDMVCVYAEPGVVANDPHPTTIVFDEIIDSVANATKRKIIVLSRSYSITSWKQELIRALNNENVGGVCFEAHVTHTKEIIDYKIVDGLSLALSRGKLAFLLLPPDGEAKQDYEYEEQLESTFNYLESNSSLLENPDFFIIIAAYNRLREDKNTEMLGEKNSVEAGLKRLRYLRSKKNRP